MTDTLSGLHRVLTYYDASYPPDVLTPPGSEPLPVLTSINPTELPVGPPDDTTLHCIGTDFTRQSIIRFGGIDERTDYVSATEVTTLITEGLFPDPDPAVAVTVFTPGGGESAPQTFAFTAVEETPETEPPPDGNGETPEVPPPDDDEEPSA